MSTGFRRRSATREEAVLVRQLDAEAVDLGLDGERDAGLGALGIVDDAEALQHAIVEAAQVLLVVRVVEGQHRHGAHDLGERRRRRRRDALGGRPRHDPVGVLGLERAQPHDHAVVLDIADGRGGLDVVAAIVLAELVDQVQVLLLGHRHRRSIPRRRGGCKVARARDLAAHRARCEAARRERRVVACASSRSSTAWASSQP
jgi:hypothetical protein